MKSLFLAAGLAVAVTANASTLRAADLDFGASERYSSPYDDPRYRDLYGTPRVTERHEYEERVYPAPLPRDDYRYGRPYPPRFVEEDRFAAHCLPRSEIRHRLRADGWEDFHSLEIRRDVALLRARRPSGNLYDLKVDRCTGEVVSARRLDHFVPGPFAYGPRRWSRPYY